MQLLFLAALIGGLVAIVPTVSYADSDFVLIGNGFGTINGNIDAASLQMSLKFLDSGKTEFQSGKILLGDDIQVIDEASLSLFYNKKFLRLNAESGDLRLSASGKLVLNVDDDSIYHLTGRTSTNDVFSVFARLKQDQAPPSPIDEPVQKKDLLLLVKQTERVQWKSPYKFTVRAFDLKSNPLSDFYNTFGYLEGLQVSATVTNPVGTVIKTSSGTTQKFGYYDDSIIIPDNSRTGTYKLSVTASGKDYQSITQEFTFVVIPLGTS